MMTTIAYELLPDGRASLACTTGVVINDDYGGDAPLRIISLCHNGASYFYAYAGSAALSMAFVEFLEGKREAAPEPAEYDRSYNKATDFGFLINEEGECFTLHGNGLLTQTSLVRLRDGRQVAATGSGRTYASGAFWAGASAEDAVRAAIYFDFGSVGNVAGVKCDPKKGFSAPYTMSMLYTMDV